MDFPGMGAGEILAIIVVALIIWGPGRIVNISRGLGKMAYNFRKVTSDLTTQITKETEEHENERPPH